MVIVKTLNKPDIVLLPKKVPDKNKVRINPLLDLLYVYTR